MKVDSNIDESTHDAIRADRKEKKISHEYNEKYIESFERSLVENKRKTEVINQRIAKSQDSLHDAFTEVYVQQHIPERFLGRDHHQLESMAQDLYENSVGLDPARQTVPYQAQSDDLDNGQLETNVIEAVKVLLKEQVVLRTINVQVSVIEDVKIDVSLIEQKGKMSILLGSRDEQIKDMMRLCLDEIEQSIQPMIGRELSLRVV